MAKVEVPRLNNDGRREIFKLEITLLFLIHLINKKNKQTNKAKTSSEVGVYLC